jgi:hypothetical protein
LRYSDDVDAKPEPELDGSIASPGIAAGDSWLSLSPKSDGTVMRYLL